MPVQVVNMTGHVLDTHTYYNGSVEYFGSEHMPYAILAICICVTVNIIPLVLLCVYPCQCFQSCLNYCRLINFNLRLRIFVDIFQGHYKLKPFDCRYFSIFFLTLRIVGLLTFFLVFGLILIPITAFNAIMRPYKKEIYNVIDVFLLVTIMFCFTATSISICSIENECILLINVAYTISAAFFPLYALIISVYKLFPKVLCKHLNKCPTYQNILLTKT